MSPTGLEQAQALGRALKAAAPIDRVYASDLTRAHTTARAVRDDLAIDPAWRECHVGEWEGKTHEEIAAQYPEQLMALLAGEEITIGGGESLKQFRDRVHAAFLATTSASIERGHSRIAIVSHGGVVATLLKDWLGISSFREAGPLGRIRNTSVTTVRIVSPHQTPKILAFNDVSHHGLLTDSVRKIAKAGLIAEELAAHAETLSLASDEWSHQDAHPHSIRAHATKALGELAAERFELPRARSVTHFSKYAGGTRLESYSVSASS